MTNINCIIVEDEPLAMERVKNYVAKIPYLNMVASFDNGVDALVCLQTNTVQILFLDINIGEVSGIRLLETTGWKGEVIILTAYHEFAVKGFDLNVTDYLLKPFTLERFIQAVEKAKINIIEEKTAIERKFVFIRSEYRLEKVVLEDILYIEGMRDYRRIHTKQKKIMTLQTFREMEAVFPATLICRVHKSYMVSIDKIDVIDREGIRIGELLIPLSDSYRDQFYRNITGKNT